MVDKARAPQLSERAQPGQWINAQWTTMDKANLTTAFPASQDHARIVFDCRTVNNAASMALNDSCMRS